MRLGDLVVVVRPHFATPMPGPGADRGRCAVCGKPIYRASGPGMGRAFRHGTKP